MQKEPHKWAKLTVFFGLVSLLFSALSYAQERAELAEFMSAQVVVNSQTQAERNRAYHEGLKEVIVRISGHKAVLDNTTIKQALNRASNFMTQYSYQRRNEHLYLLINYNAELIIQLLREAGAPVWNLRRPKLTLWMVTEKNNKYEFVSPENNAELYEKIEEEAKRRGVLLVYPLYDLTDLMTLSPSDVWGRFEVPVLEATSRYKSDGALMIRVINHGAEQQLSWRYLIGRLSAQGEALLLDDVQALSSSSLAQALINTLAESLANNYSVSFNRGEENLVKLRLMHVTQLASILAAERLLAGLSPVSDVSLARYNGSTAEFELTIVGHTKQLIQTLELEEALQRIEDPWSQYFEDELEYRWLQ